VLAAHSELTGPYWQLGQLILDRQQADAWGASVIERLSADLRHDFSETTGCYPGTFGTRALWSPPGPATSIVPQVVARVPWSHNEVLIDKLDDPTLRERYAGQPVEHACFWAVLANQTCPGVRLRRRQARMATSRCWATSVADGMAVISAATRRATARSVLSVRRIAAVASRTAAAVTRSGARTRATPARWHAAALVN
jgi:hypothetical protein